MSGCLPTDSECEHGCMVNAIQNSILVSILHHGGFSGNTLTFNQAEIFICELRKQGYEIKNKVRNLTKEKESKQQNKVIFSGPYQAFPNP